MKIQDVIDRMDRGFTLNGKPGVVVGIIDGKFIKVRTRDPLVPGVWGEGEWNFETAARVMDKGGKFKL